jgi:cytochrome c553
MKKLTLVITALALSALSLTAAPNGKALSAKCAGCHGIDFSKHALGRSDIVKGWSARRVTSVLIGYKTTRESDELVMKKAVSNLSKSQIKAIAKYISSIK